MGPEDKFVVCGGGAGNAGYKCTRSEGEGGLGMEGHGSGYMGHIGIGMVCRVGVC